MTEKQIMKDKVRNCIISAMESKNIRQVLISRLLIFCDDNLKMESLFNFNEENYIKAFFTRKVNDFDIILELTILPEEDSVFVAPHYYIAQNGEICIDDNMSNYECSSDDIVNEAYRIIECLNKDYCQGYTK